MSAQQLTVVRLEIVSEMAHQMAQRLLTALDHVEKLYPTNTLETGDVPPTLSVPSQGQPNNAH